MATPARPVTPLGKTETTATTLRYFGRCPVTGCKHRRVIEQASSPLLKRYTTRSSDVLAVLDADGRDWPLYYLGGKDWADAMRGAGFSCPEHKRVVTFEGGRFTHNTEKVCNGKCMGATGPACDCSCGGENHGRGHL